MSVLRATQPSRRPSLRLATRLTLTGAALALAACGSSSPSSSPKATSNASSSTAIVRSRTVGAYGSVLTNGAGRSLYVLSSESNGTLHCTTSACTALWPPLLVAKGASLRGTGGMRGTLGHVSRGGKWQVTYNGYPLYTYAGDSGAGQTHGEGIVSFGGTWDLARAGATSGPSTRDVATSGSSSTSSTSGGGYGY